MITISRILDNPSGSVVHLVERLICPDYNFKMFIVYVLRSRNDEHYYIGSCKDIGKRLLSHNSLGVKSTKRYAPWDVVHTEYFATIREARVRELKIKSWKKRAKLEALIKTF